MKGQHTKSTLSPYTTLFRSVADVDGALELHRVDADRSAPAKRMAGGDDAGGEVHLRHQPAAEDVARRVGVARHRDRPDRGLVHHCTIVKNEPQKSRSAR